MHLDNIRGQIVGDVIVHRNWITDVHLANVRILQLNGAAGARLSVRVLEVGVPGNQGLNSAEGLGIQELLCRRNRDLFHVNCAVKVRIQQVCLLNGAALAFKRDSLFPLAFQVCGGFDGELPVGREIRQRQINMVI